MSFRKIILLRSITLILILFTLQAYAGVLYVKLGGTGDGTSWVTDFDQQLYVDSIDREKLTNLLRKRGD